MRKALLQHIVENPVTGEKVPFGSLLKQRTVVALLRRFGCILCRAGAAELSRAKPELSQAGVSMLALGIEKLGHQEFVDGHYFDGPIFIDEKRAVYKELGATRASAWSVLRPSMFFSGFKSVPLCKPECFITGVTFFRASKQGFAGNFAGDGLQLGGTFVLDPDGTVLYGYAQKSFEDHAPVADVIAAAKLNRDAIDQIRTAVNNANAADADAQQGLKDKEAVDKALELVQRSIQNNKVFVFSKSTCPYCRMAKQVLTDVHASFEVLELDKHPEGPEIQQALFRLTGRETVPNVFIGGKSIGGGDDTKRLKESGELAKLVAATS